jgi:hypothetical protein
LGWIKQINQKVWFNNGLLYDFGVSVGDTVYTGIVLNNSSKDYLPDYEFGSRCCIIENIVYENGIKKIFTNNDVWIEGMGSFAGIFGNNIMKCLCEDWYEFSLGCFKHNGIIKYINNVCNSCFNCPFYFPICDWTFICVENNEQWCVKSSPRNIYFDYSDTPIQITLYALLSEVPSYFFLYPITYHWTTNSETYIIEDSTASHPIFSFSGDVSVFLKLTDRIGAVAFASANLIMTPQYVEEDEFLKQILIFPNPADDILIIHSSNNELINSIEIMDITGKVIDKHILNAEKYELSISDLKPAFYLVKIITNNNSIYTKKIIKK